MNALKGNKLRFRALIEVGFVGINALKCYKLRFRALIEVGFVI